MVEKNITNDAIDVPANSVVDSASACGSVSSVFTSKIIADLAHDFFSWMKTFPQEKTKREAIIAWRDVNTAKIDSITKTITNYFDAEFKQRKDLVDNHFEKMQLIYSQVDKLIDMVKDAGDRQYAMEFCSMLIPLLLNQAAGHADHITGALKINPLESAAKFLPGITEADNFLIGNNYLALDE